MIEISLLGDGECRITAQPSGAEIRSSKSPEYGGTGDGFSSTDLLAAALGSCIATNLEPVALRHDLSLADLQVTVEKTLSISPKRLAELIVRIELRRTVAGDVLKRLERAASHCVVHQSLSSDVSVKIEFTGVS